MQLEPGPETGEAHLLDQNQSVGALRGAPAVLLVTLNKPLLIARPPRRRRVFRMSALSTVDGRFCAYHGCNG
jgi:hypothetical protein